MMDLLVRLAARAAEDERPKQFADPLKPTPEELALLPHDDQGPKLVGVGWMLVSIACLFLSLRLYCRILKRQSLWWDDAFLIGACICLIADISLITSLTRYGYGKHIWDFDFSNMKYLMLPMNIASTLTITSTVWSKTSFGITLLHLTNGTLRKITWACIISMNVIMGLNALLAWIQCKPLKKAWDVTVDGTCWDPKVMPAFNMFAGAYSALMDIILALLPWNFLWSLQMKTNEKIGVGLAMSMGIFAGITAIVKTTMVPKMLSNDFADGIDLWIWNLAEPSVTVIAASIPMLRVIVRDAKSSRNYGSGYKKETSASVNRSRIVTIQSKAQRKDSDTELRELGDDRSDRYILETKSEKAGVGGKGGIMHVVDFSVEYDGHVSDGKTPV
ncbi:hypothetical protein QBC42DRAFT_219432 [Cladorrhinum samala]|uniref:Rhodopsin domain-containing protein n=1 Tax=Cladorrhinum samala TaxID=585594 RepID=A0AAV9HW54_9PEZI|nr:hypothetical protein QBC42DRAFT_219432 [Cladorrhinum samala]